MALSDHFSKLKGRFSSLLERHTQGILLSLVLVIGLSAMLLGTISIQRTIRQPFAAVSNSSGVAPNSALAVDATKDTDGDTIPDQVELANYGTSPFLADSDSDGKSDSEEIAIGKDPNCPEGQTCGRDVVVPTTEFGAAFPPSADATQISAAELRTMLRQSGISEEQLSELTDQQLLASYNQALSNVDAPTTNQPSTQPVSTDSLNTLSVAEIRELLIKNGIDQNQLEGLSDADLQKLFSETIASLTPTSSTGN